MKSDSEFKNIKYGAFLGYVSLFLSIGIHIVFTPILLNRIGDFQYGLWAFVTSITSWFNVVAYALNDSYIRFQANEGKDEIGEGRINTVYKKILLALAAVISIIAISIIALIECGIIPLSNYAPNEKKIIVILFIISTIQINCTTIFALYRLYLEYCNRFILVKIIGIIQTVVTNVALFTAVILRPSVILVATITAFFSILSLLVFCIFAIKRMHMSFCSASLKDNSGLIKSILVFTSYLLLSTIVTEINSAVDKTLLGFFATAEIVTLYQLGMQFSVYFGEMAITVNSVFIPKINKLAANDENEKLNKTYLLISRFQSIVITLFIGGFVACGREFVAAWLGSNREDVYWIAIVLLILSAPSNANYSHRTVERAYNKHRIPAYIDLTATIINVIISVVLLKILPEEYSIVACLCGTAFSMIVGRWCAIPIYDKCAIGLSVGKFYCSFFLLIFASAISAICSRAISYKILAFLSAPSNWIAFIIIGVIYVIIFFTLVLPFNLKTIQKIVRKEI